MCLQTDTTAALQQTEAKKGKDSYSQCLFYKILPKGVPTTHELRKHRFKNQDLLLKFSLLKRLCVFNFIP